jgi:hypothetical protein
MDPTRRRQQVKKRGRLSNVVCYYRSLSIPFGVVLSSRFLNNSRQLDVKDIPGSRQASHSLLFSSYRSTVTRRYWRNSNQILSFVRASIADYKTRLLLLFTSFSMNILVLFVCCCCCCCCWVGLNRQRETHKVKMSKKPFGTANREHRNNMRAKPRRSPIMMRWLHPMHSINYKFWRSIITCPEPNHFSPFNGCQRERERKTSHLFLFSNWIFDFWDGNKYRLMIIIFWIFYFEQ